MGRGTERRIDRRRAPVNRRAPATAYDAAAILLAARDRSRARLAALLSSRGFEASEVGTALDRLATQGYLDDRRFAATWVRSRAGRRPMGVLRLRRELEKRGVEASVALDAVKGLYEDGEEAAARRALAGRESRLLALPVGSRVRHVARFLERRGFPAEVIRRLVRELQPPQRGGTWPA